MRLLKLAVVIILCNSSFIIAEGNIIDDPELLYLDTNVSSSVLNQNVTINRTFRNINDLVDMLNNMDGITAKIQNQSGDKPIPTKVVINNGTINELLKKTSLKLGYSWKLIDEIIVFSALNPQKTNINKNITQPMAMSSKVQSSWIIDPKFKTLRSVLSYWCKQSGWQLMWNVKVDYPITTNWNIQGNFESAINEVLKASQNTDTPLQAIMHDSNKVLEIYTVTASK